MYARWWYRREKEQNMSKKSRFFLKPLKCTQEVLKQNLCVYPILLPGWLSLRNWECRVKTTLAFEQWLSKGVNLQQI